jgi:hypothetical protein
MQIEEIAAVFEALNVSRPPSSSSSRPSPLASSLTLSCFPTEIFHYIASFCDRPSLSRLCQIDTFVREVASPILYKRLDVPSPSALEPFRVEVPLVVR